MILACPECAHPFELEQRHVSALVRIDCPTCGYGMILDFEAANDRRLVEPGTQTTGSWSSSAGYWDARQSGSAPAPSPERAEQFRRRSQSQAQTRATPARPTPHSSPTAARPATTRPGVEHRPSPAPEPRPEQESLRPSVAAPSQPTPQPGGATAGGESRVPPSLPSSPAFEAPAGGLSSKTIYPGMPGLGEALRAHTEAAEPTGSDAGLPGLAGVGGGDLATGPSLDNPEPAPAVEPESGAQLLSASPSESPTPIDLGQPALVKDGMDGMGMDGMDNVAEAETAAFDSDPESTAPRAEDVIEEIETLDDVEIEASPAPTEVGARQPPHSPIAPPSSRGPDHAPAQPLHPAGERGLGPDPIPAPHAAMKGAASSLPHLADEADEAGGGSIIGRVLFALILGALVAAGTLSYVAWSETGDWNPLPLIQSRFGG